MPTIVKVRLNEVILDVQLPEGCRRVWTGALCPGDMYLHCGKALDGLTEWLPVDLPTASEVRRGDPYSAAHWYALVIRRGTDSPQKACERCEVEPALVGYRFCRGCCRAVCGRRTVGG
jgi:hypothetical protein